METFSQLYNFYQVKNNFMNKLNKSKFISYICLIKNYDEN
jgi:hypothetical protein